MWQNTAERERERERERSSSFISVGIIKCSLPAATYIARVGVSPPALQREVIPDTVKNKFGAPDLKPI